MDLPHLAPRAEQATGFSIPIAATWRTRPGGIFYKSVESAQHTAPCVGLAENGRTHVLIGAVAMSHDLPQSGTVDHLEDAATLDGREKLERLKARQQSPKAMAGGFSQAVKAVEKLGVNYDRISAETWTVIAQHPDLEGI